MEEKKYEEYTLPLTERYASKEMSYIFSPKFKFSTWRKLWVYLAEVERSLGLEIPQEVIDKMKDKIDDIDFEYAQEREREFRHDVMAHVHTFGHQVPEAKGYIHLGATSAFVGDNTDLIQIKEALKVIKKRLINLMKVLRDFSLKYKDLPVLGYTHFQPAQPTTLGKRASLWLQDVMLVYEELEFRLKTLRFRGAKGTTGTQASYMALFGYDEEKVKNLDEEITKKAGFDKYYMVTGQTYPRIVDAQVLSTLSHIADVLSKMATDIRLLQHSKQIEEPFGKKQIGSSAMAYKRNPMRCERIGSLARFVISLSYSTHFTAATQWLERTLDDSANKRLAIPQTFLATDAIINIAINVISGMVVYPKVIERILKEELPFMATEEIIMAAVKKGKDRQDVHERLRVYAMETIEEVKMKGLENKFLEKVANDDYIGLSREELEKIIDVKKFIGRAPSQVEEFIEREIDIILENNKHLINDKYDDLKV